MQVARLTIDFQVLAETCHKAAPDTTYALSLVRSQVGMQRSSGMHTEDAVVIRLAPSHSTISLESQLDVSELRTSRGNHP